MNRPSARFALCAAGISIVVCLIGAAFTGGPDRAGVVTGVAAAFAFQVLAFWVLAGLLFPGRAVLVYGLGMLGRFALFALVALVAVPLLGVPAVPTLLSLVATLFATTLVEPVFLQTAHSIGR